MGHLPIASALGIGLTSSIVFYVVIANSLFGLIAGYLYWKKGLEAAIIAHMLAHVVIVTAIYFGA
jgi:membrane protease YdiL (CAAX protease family)